MYKYCFKIGRGTNLSFCNSPFKNNGWFQPSQIWLQHFSSHCQNFDHKLIIISSFKNLHIIFLTISIKVYFIFVVFSLYCFFFWILKPNNFRSKSFQFCSYSRYTSSTHLYSYYSLFIPSSLKSFLSETNF